MFADYDAHYWITLISNLLDARLCLRVKGRTTVTPGFVHENWELFKHESIRNESGGKVRPEGYLR